MTMLGCIKYFKIPLMKKATDFMEECKYGTKKIFIPSLLPIKNFSSWKDLAHAWNEDTDRK